MKLILDMKNMGHPSYACIDEETVQSRAAMLPIDGIPPEALKVIQQDASDETHDKLQPQKAAAPCDGRLGPLEAGQAFAAQPPRAIVAEGNAGHNASHVAQAALEDMAARLAPPSETPDAAAAGIDTLEIRTGNEMLDQFQPGYFSIAFPFCFPHATACPDVFNVVKQPEEQAISEGTRPRRQAGNPNAPSVTFNQHWAPVMARRAESQLRRDWNFGFTMWNFYFRTCVNLQPNTYMYVHRDQEGGGGRMMTNEEIGQGCKELMTHLRNGKYRDITGELKAVKGDVTKLRHVPGLSEAAKKTLANVEARTRNIPGTHEVRKTMRHQTHANRVAYGTAIFLTFSPSERDTTLMVRLARARQADPAILADRTGRFQGREKPELDVDYMRLSPEALVEDRVPRQTAFHRGSAFVCLARRSTISISILSISLCKATGICAGATPYVRCASCTALIESLSCMKQTSNFNQRTTAKNRSCCPMTSGRRFWHGIHWPVWRASGFWCCWP